jgi:hypothetical protein
VREWKRRKEKETWEGEGGGKRSKTLHERGGVVKKTVSSVLKVPRM